MNLPQLRHVLTAVSAGIVILLAGSAHADSREFTPHERQLLEKGKLVKRQVTQRRGGLHLVGGTSWQVIDADVDHVWKVITDVRTYRQLFPHVVDARLVAKRGDFRLVYLEHASGPFHVSYSLKGQADAKRRDLTFELDTSRPRDITAAWGFFTVRPYGKGKSILAYGVMLDIGTGILSALLRDKIRGSMLHIPRNVRKYIHERYPKATVGHARSSEFRAAEPDFGRVAVNGSVQRGAAAL